MAGLPSSNQLHALTTAGQVGALLGLVAMGWLWRWDRGVSRPLARSARLRCWPGLRWSPLNAAGATKLYLFGISVDQQFRTEYLTRLTDSPALHDMTYAGLPPFYPPGWFWLGGRAAAFTGTPAWEMFKPWAVTSIAVAIAVAFALWSRMIRFEYALAVTAATAAVTLAFSSPEPQRDHHGVDPAGIAAGLVRPAGDGGARRHSGAGGHCRGRVFLGFAATFYTPLLAYTAFTVTVMAGSAAVVRRSAGPLLRLAVIAVIAAAIGRSPGCRSCCVRSTARWATPAPPSTTCPRTARC